MSVLFRTSGTMQAPAFVLRRGGGGLGAVRMPATIAVVERPDGLVLVDAGWSRSQCAWPERDPGRAKTLFLGLDVKPEDAIASQLLSLGYSPGDVKHIVATHLHIDHIGGAADFPKATVHCAETEWAAAWRRGRPSYDPRALDLPTVQRWSFTGPAALGFGASHDLFGDGTVLLLDARGHTEGSTAVAVKLAGEGWMVHAGDAAMFADDVRDDASKPPSLYMRALSWSIPAQRETYARLDAAEREHGARLVPAHDWDVYNALPHTREEAWPCAWTRVKKPKR